MIYLKWRLSTDGVSGTGPEETIAGRGGHAEAGWAVDADGYRIGYVTDTTDLSGLETWNAVEVIQADALAFFQTVYADAAVDADGRITGPPPPDEPT